MTEKVHCRVKIGQDGTFRFWSKICAAFEHVDTLTFFRYNHGLETLNKFDNKHTNFQRVQTTFKKKTFLSP